MSNRELHRFLEYIEFEARYILLNELDKNPNLEQLKHRLLASKMDWGVQAQLFERIRRGFDVIQFFSFCYEIALYLEGFNCRNVLTFEQVASIEGAYHRRDVSV